MMKNKCAIKCLFILEKLLSLQQLKQLKVIVRWMGKYYRQFCSPLTSLHKITNLPPGKYLQLTCFREVESVVRPEEEEIAPSTTTVATTEVRDTSDDGYDSFRRKLLYHE
jgi:hypothetical protein